MKYYNILRVDKFKDVNLMLFFIKKTVGCIGIERERGKGLSHVLNLVINQLMWQSRIYISVRTIEHLHCLTTSQ